MMTFKWLAILSFLHAAFGATGPIAFDTRFRCVVTASSSKQVHVGSSTKSLLTVNELMDTAGLIMLTSPSGNDEQIFVYGDLSEYANDKPDLYLATDTTVPAETFGYLRFAGVDKTHFTLTAAISRNAMLANPAGKIISVPGRTDRFELACTVP